MCGTRARLFRTRRKRLVFIRTSRSLCTCTYPVHAAWPAEESSCYAVGLFAHSELSHTQRRVSYLRSTRAFSLSLPLPLSLSISLCFSPSFSTCLSFVLSVRAFACMCPHECLRLQVRIIVLTYLCFYYYHSKGPWYRFDETSTNRSTFNFGKFIFNSPLRSTLFLSSPVQLIYRFDHLTYNIFRRNIDYFQRHYFYYSFRREYVKSDLIVVNIKVGGGHSNGASRPCFGRVRYSL